MTKRVSDLTREGLWSEKRLPKVCERPRPRTHWDSVLTGKMSLNLLQKFFCMKMVFQTNMIYSDVKHVNLIYHSGLRLNLILRLFLQTFNAISESE